MDLHDTPTPPAPRAVRHDGWTPERRARFLDCLAAGGNVQRACRAAGLSPEAAYRLKRREALFARAWAAALVLAREATEQVIAERAIDGIEENVWHRGELLETRRRYDTRLLLAHMARLDRLAEDAGARADAARFDELVACAAGYEVPDRVLGDDGVPLEREAVGLRIGEAAEREAGEVLEALESLEAEELDAQTRDELIDECIAAWRDGRAEGEALWDDWFSKACGFVDSVAEARPPVATAEAIERAARATMAAAVSCPWTPSTSSTSALAESLAEAEARAAAQPSAAPNRAARRATKARERRA